MGLKVSKKAKLFSSERFEKALSLAMEHDSFCVQGLDILMPMNPDEDLAVALLVKGLFSENILSEKQVEELFGKSVLDLLKAVKKIENLSYKENDRTSQLEILRKMFLTMAKDIRVVLLSLVCRLVQLKNGVVSENPFFAQETLDLYVPIADRLGIYNIKTEMEDVSFKHTNPVEYKDISEKLQSIKKTCEISIEWIKKKLESFFLGRGINADVSGRIKGVHSIYRKLKKKGLNSPEDLYDVFAMRIVLPERKDALGNTQVDHLYSALGVIHSEWKPMTRRFKDYIAVPKSNGYKSLHTVVLGLAPKDMAQPVEIQIRDEKMHMDSEFGIASHWVYKETGVVANFGALKAHADWLKGISDIRDGFNDLDVFKDKIFVLTPRGEVKDLPVMSCPIDFAYAVHTDVGNRCIMAKVDGRIVPLDYELRNGEVVEIITKGDGVPKIQWLSIAKSGFARNKIKAYFSSLNRENNIKLGRDLLNNNLERIGKPPLDQNYTILKHYFGKNLNLAQRETILEEVGKGGKFAHDVAKRIYPYEEAVVQSVVLPVKTKQKKAEGDIDNIVIEKKVLIGGEEGLPIKLAACCTPKFGDNILGYVTRGNSVTVHKMDCQMIGALDFERFVSAHWKVSADDKTKYIIGIKIIVMPRVGLMNEITAEFVKRNVIIRDIGIKEIDDGGLCEDYFLLEMDDLNKFDLVMDGLEKIDAVLKITRAEKKD